jgi:hypothetical protein
MVGIEFLKMIKGRGLSEFVQRKFKVHWSKVLEGWLSILSSKSVECEQRRCRVRSGNWNSSARFFFFLFFFMRKGRPST